MRKQISNEDIIELLSYAEICNDEYGEYCKALIELYNAGQSIGSSFCCNIGKQILKELTYFKTHAKIITEIEETRREVQTLEWDKLR